MWANRAVCQQPRIQPEAGITLGALRVRGQGSCTAASTSITRCPPCTMNCCLPRKPHDRRRTLCFVTLVAQTPAGVPIPVVSLERWGIRTHLHLGSDAQVAPLRAAGIGAGSIANGAAAWCVATHLTARTRRRGRQPIVRLGRRPAAPPPLHLRDDARPASADDANDQREGP